MPRPLSHIRVLDLTRVLAGPVAGRTLAEHGADVLRLTAPHLPGFPDSVDIDTGHGKLSAFLDLRDADADAGRDRVATPERRPPKRQMKHRFSVRNARLPVAAGHRQLVQVGQERQGSVHVVEAVGHL